MTRPRYRPRSGAIAVLTACAIPAEAPSNWARAPERGEARGLAHAAAQKRDQQQRTDADEVHPAPAPSRVRDDAVEAAARNHAEQSHHVEHRDARPAHPVGKLLADHDDRDGELRRKKNLGAALEKRERAEPARERGQQREQRVEEHRRRYERLAPDPIREHHDNEREHPSQPHERRHRTDRAIVQMEGARDIRRAEMKDRYVVALEDRHRHQQPEQRPLISAQAEEAALGRRLDGAVERSFSRVWNFHRGIATIGSVTTKAPKLGRRGQAVLVSVLLAILSHSRAAADRDRAAAARPGRRRLHDPASRHRRGPRACALCFRARRCR